MHLDGPFGRYRCVSCNAPAATLSTALGPKEYALSTCTRCEAFVDPYIEHGTELLLVDLLLIKRSVYCHLLRNAETSASNKPFLKLAIIVFAAETYLTWSRQALQMSWDPPSDTFVNGLAAQIASTLLLHVAAFLLCRMYARLARSTKPRLRTVSQALFVASTTKLFFLSLGLIWRSVEDADAPTFGLSIEDLILQATEFASRAVALSAAIDRSLVLGGLVAFLAGTLPYLAGLAMAR